MTRAAAAEVSEPTEPVGASTTWNGFAATAYRLDSRIALNLPLTVLRSGPTGEREEVNTTLGGVFVGNLADQPSVESSPTTLLLGDKVTEGRQFTVGDSELVVAGSSFSCALLDVLLSLRQDRIEFVATSWFYYDCNRGPYDTPYYSFFVVYDGRIVRDRVEFSGNTVLSDEGFTPSVFLANSADDWEWAFLHDKFRVASDRFWYRKFYQETEAGQLMALRPDSPELHHFPQGRWRPDLAWDDVTRRLAHIQRTLWLLVILITLGIVLMFQ